MFEKMFIPKCGILFCCALLFAPMLSHANDGGVDLPYCWVACACDADEGGSEVDCATPCIESGVGGETSCGALIDTYPEGLICCNQPPQVTLGLSRRGPAELEITFMSEKPISGFQFTLTSGLTVDFCSADWYVADEGAALENDFTLGCNAELHSILGYTMEGADSFLPITDENQTLMVIQFAAEKVSNVVSDGSICLDNIVIADASGQALRVATTGCACGFCPGDNNGDGGFNVLDIVTLVQVILNSSTCACYNDFNGDSNCNVLDIVPLVNCILSGTCSDNCNAGG